MANDAFPAPPSGEAAKNRGLAKSIMQLLARTAILSLLFAFIMSFFVDGIQCIGIAPWPFPFSALGQYQGNLASITSKDPLAKSFAEFLLLYNCAFPLNSRLGCGIGMIAAAFWTLHDTKTESRLHRATMGALAGAIIGFRMALMISSKAQTVLAGSLLFALVLSLYMLMSARKEEITDLPILQEST